MIIQLLTKYYQAKIQVLTGLGSLQLFLELGFFLLKALDLMLHLVKLSRVLTVSFIKFVPCSESFIKIFCNFCILLSQGVPTNIKLEISRRTDWQHPTSATNDMLDIIKYSISAKTK